MYAPQMLEEQGCSTLARGASDWRIAADKHPYMWRCMVHFIATATLLSMLTEHSMQASADWLAEMHAHRPTIVAQNTDILMQAHFKPAAATADSLLLRGAYVHVHTLSHAAVTGYNVRPDLY